MNEEKYGIQLDAVTSLFKRKMQDLSSFIRKFGKEAEEETTILPKISPEISKKELLKWREDLEKAINKAKDDMEFASPQVMTKLKGDIKDYQFNLQAINKRLQEISESEKKAEDDLEDMGEKAEKSSSTLSNLFDKSIGKIKRFTYYLLGARSVFSLFMKYQSIYYQYNEQMQYQSELSQNAIALSLAPAFEFLGNVVAYASIGIAKFVELLTGVNVLSKVSTKGIRDYNKGLKETQTLLSGVDEITNLTLPSGTGLASQYAALDDFQKKVVEVTEWFNKNTWINTIAEGLKNVFSYVSDHWDIFKYILGAAAIASIFGGGPMTITIVGLASFGTFLGLLKEYIDLLNDREKRQKENEIFYRELLARYVNDLPKEWQKEFEGAEKGTEEWNEKVEWVKDGLKGALETIVDGKLEYEQYKPIIDAFIQELQKLDEETFTPEIDFLVSLKGDKNEIDLIKAYIKGGKLSLGGGGTGAYGGSNYSGGGSRGYANGLDYVPYDEYPAILHKGEAVVPAKYNPTIHSQGNEYTNSLLETLIVSVQDLANRPNVFEVDGNEFAKATYPLYRNEENRQNYNAKVSVR